MEKSIALIISRRMVNENKGDNEFWNDKKKQLTRNSKQSTERIKRSENIGARRK